MGQTARSPLAALDENPSLKPGEIGPWEGGCKWHSCQGSDRWLRERHAVMSHLATSIPFDVHT